MYVLRISKNAQKSFQKISNEQKLKIKEKLALLSKNPFDESLDVKQLKSVSVGRFRLRCGDYRIRYDFEKKYIDVFKIMHRKDIYK